MVQQVEIYSVNFTQDKHNPELNSHSFHFSIHIRWFANSDYENFIKSYDFLYYVERGTVDIELFDGGGFLIIESVLSADRRHQHRPRRGNLVLFPSSQFHSTVPIETKKERLVVAFDLVPLND